MPNSEPPRKDDINQYLTWSNVIKVAFFLCSVIWFFAEQVKGDTTRDLEAQQTNKNIVDLTSAFKELKTELKTTSDINSQRFISLEKKVDILTYDVENLKQENKERRK